MINPLTRHLFACCLLFFCSTSAVQASGTQLLSELAEQSLAARLNGAGPLLIAPAGDELIVGNFLSPGLTRFKIEADGSLGLRGSTQLDALGTTLSNASALTINSAGNLLYVAGEHQIAVFARDTTSGNLNLLSTVLVDSLLTTRDLTLSSDEQHLYVVSNNFTQEIQLGASALYRYNVNATDGSLTLASSRQEPSSANPITRINFASASDLTFLGRRSMLEVSRRNSASGALTLLQTHNGISGGTPTAAGDWLFTAEFTKLQVYRVDNQSGDVTRTQQFRTAIPPAPDDTFYAATEIALSAAEDRLLVTGWVPVGAFPGGTIRTVSSIDVLSRNPANGQLKYDGQGLRSGANIVRHPIQDWFYTLIPSIAQVGFPPTTPVLAQQGLVSTPPDTQIVAAVLPTSRTEGDRQNRNEPVTAFATVLNPGSTDAVGCHAGVLRDSIRGLKFRVTTTDPVTNEPTNFTDGLFDVPAGGATQLIFELRTEIDPLADEITDAPELLDVRFYCRNADMTDRITGVTTFAFASDTQPLPDLLTATASPDQPGIVSLSNPQDQSFFTVAAINLGGSAFISAKGAVQLAGAIEGATALANPPNLRLLICETDPTTSECKAPFADRAERTIATNEVVTYTVLVIGRGDAVAFRPDIHRAFVLLQDENGFLRGGSSVAVETR